MKKFTEHLAEDRRLRILELLHESGGQANEDVILTALSNIGHPRLTRQSVRDDLRFLIDRGALVEEWLDDLMIVKVTRRGVDIVKGHLEVAGIKPPSIGV